MDPYLAGGTLSLVYGVKIVVISGKAREWRKIPARQFRPDGEKESYQKICVCFNI